MRGFELDPLIAARDTNKPLLSKLLAVPSLRARYLGYVRDIADRWLDWGKLGPLVWQYQALIAEEVKLDTRKLYSYEAFVQGLEGNAPAKAGVAGGLETSNMKNFAEKRRAYLLDHSAVK